MSKRKHGATVAAFLEFADRIERRQRDMRKLTIDPGTDIADELADVLHGIAADARRVAQVTAEAARIAGDIGDDRGGDDA